MADYGRGEIKITLKENADYGWKRNITMGMKRKIENITEVYESVEDNDGREHNTEKI